MTITGLKVLFVAGFGPVVANADASRNLYVETLQLPLTANAENPDYFHGERLDGVRHFALWPLKSAAESCFGTSVWPADVQFRRRGSNSMSRMLRRPATC